MREKIAIHTDGAPTPGGSYSQGIRAGGFVFTAGVGPFDPSTGQLKGSTIEDQTRQVLESLSAVLEASGSTMADVVKVTTHLASLDDFPGYDSVYREFFGSPLPARTTVGSSLPGILVEIDVVALTNAPE
jgi:2-iminobutanoate/2-iminopropanoate deaminase